MQSPDISRIEKILTEKAEKFEIFSRLLAEYNQKFGPITPNQSNDDNHWSWIDDPWPWERS